MADETETTETEESTETEETTEAPWYGELSSDLKKVADRFDGPEAALNSIVNFQKRDSQIRVPGKDAEESEVAVYHKAMGIPDSAEGYEFPELPEAELTDDVKAERAEWADVFHANKVPAEVATVLTAKLFEIQGKIVEKQIVDDKALVALSSEKLKADWGKDYDRNTNDAARALSAIGQIAGVDIEAMKQIEMKDGRFLLDVADFSRLFAAVGSQMREGSLGGTMTEGDRDSLDAQVKEIRKQIAQADLDGDRKLKNQLYVKEQDLLARAA